MHVDIKKTINKYKNISKKMSEYVGFSPPPTLSVISDCCKTKQAKPSSVCRKYVGGGENPTYSLIFLEMFLYLYIYIRYHGNIFGLRQNFLILAKSHGLFTGSQGF